MIYWANIRSIIGFIILLWDFLVVLCRPTNRMDTKRKYTKLIRNGFSEIKRNTSGFGNILNFRKWFLNELILLGRAESVVAVLWVTIHLTSTDFLLLIYGLEVSHSPTFTLELCFQYLGWETCKIFYVDYYRFYILSKLAMRMD